MTACRNVGSDRSKGRSSYGSFSEETSEMFSLRSRITRSPYWQERNLYTRINRLRLRNFPQCERLSVSHGGFRSGLCGNRGRLLHNRLLRCRSFLDRRTLLSRLCWCFHRRFLRSGFLPGRCRFLGCWFRLRSFGGSGLLQIRNEVCLCCRRKFPFRTCGWCGCLGWLGFSPDLGPSKLLGFLHPSSSGSGEFPAFALGEFRLGCGWLGGTTGKHGSEFCNLCVDTQLLLFKADDGGVDYFIREFGRHVRCSFWILSVLLTLLVPYYTCPVIDPRADHLSCVSAVTVGGVEFGVELSSRDERSGRERPDLEDRQQFRRGQVSRAARGWETGT